ncbi:hypothetical protein L873DRAFT_1801869 [Choiromyces venosus 120613-1]|uniref:Uncharacterized protein n=1 Tax=Choiromyces venosus 120613-1 TaxID=1336337 RepID=A0A3N4JWV5_9PEZI|nr:hypothetical protein L873DRAFT_1801869 [Choiromyces venosus 120613-1]
MGNYFLSTFKRHYLYKYTKADKRIIADGNLSAHAGKLLSILCYMQGLIEKQILRT